MTAATPAAPVGSSGAGLAPLTVGVGLGCGALGCLLGFGAQRVERLIQGRVHLGLQLSHQLRKKWSDAQGRQEGGVVRSAASGAFPAQPPRPRALR